MHITPFFPCDIENTIERKCYARKDFIELSTATEVGWESRHSE